VLLSDLDITALRTLPAGLRVTLLINQGDLGRQVEKALLSSTRRHFVWARGKQPMDFFGAHVLHCDSASGQIGLSVWINPTRLQFPNFTEDQERAMASQFQSRLVAYRMSYHARVRKFEIEAGATRSGVEDQLQTWLAALPEGSELKKSVSQAFAELNAELLGARYEDPKCLVAEAALMFCHRNAEHFLVRELAEKVNDLLRGRHADFKLEDRKVGSVLKALGIRARRVTKGYRVKLDDAMRKRIHHIASAYQVLSIQSDAVRCAQCKSEFAKNGNGTNV
jgi:hypothetical protein